MAKMREEVEKVTEEALVVKARTKQKEIDLEELAKVSLERERLIFSCSRVFLQFFLSF